jgi:hypothetical protein
MVLKMYANGNAENSEPILPIWGRKLYTKCVKLFNTLNEKHGDIL